MFCLIMLIYHVCVAVSVANGCLNDDRTGRIIILSYRYKVISVFLNCFLIFCY